VAPADLLSGSFVPSGSSTFALSGFGAFANLSAGQADAAPTVTFQPAATGSFSETITLNSTGSNASGYSAALAPRTLTVTGIVTPSQPGKIQTSLNGAVAFINDQASVGLLAQSALQFGSAGAAAASAPASPLSANASGTLTLVAPT